MEIAILKCHGSGNDFILIDNMEGKYELSDQDKKNLAITLCNRNAGIGADGILLMEDSSQADSTMRIFNTDGTEADMCANGLRIAGRYISEKKQSSKVGIQNITNITYDTLNEREIFQNVIGIEVTMPPVNFKAEKVPVIFGEEEVNQKIILDLDKELLFTAASLPNPHIISFVDVVDEKKLIEIGKKANNLKSVFPKGVNVSFVRIISKTMIYVGTYERGVGITNSCGTAMFASVACAIKNKKLPFDKVIKIINKGGFVTVIVHEDFTGKMHGNATYIFRSCITWDRKFPFKYAETNRILINAETHAYDKLEASVHEYIQSSNI